MRIVADFARKSKKMFVSNYDSQVESFLGRLITYIKDDLLNTYETLGDVFEEILLEIEERKKEGVTLNPDIYLMLDPLYTSLAHKCQLPVRLIKELNITDESKAHHISGMAEEIIRNREFT